MKQAVILAALLLGTIVSGAASAGGKITGARIFAVDYTKTQESVKAQIAKGDPNGRLIHADRPLRFDFEPLSTAIYGLMVGANRSSVRYAGAGHFPKRGGSIELTVKNCDWEYNSSKIHMFLNFVAKDLQLCVYKFRKDGIGVYAKNKLTNKSLFLRQMPKNWKINSIHHLAYTWDGTGYTVLYLDGRQVAKGFVELPETPVKYIDVGPAGKLGSEGNSAIGHVRIYNRPLTEKEVVAVAGELIPELKKKGLQVTKDIMLPSSFWFKNKVKLGMEALDGNYVPAPFKPVSARGATLSVWERDYDFSGSGILDQVKAKNEKLLRKSVNLTINGKALKLGNFKVVKREKGRIEFVKSAPNADLKGTFEYDGLVHFRLTLRPGEQIREMTLQMPMSKSASEYLHFVGATDRIGGDYGPTTARGSNTIEISKKPGIAWKKRFGNHTWMGSTRSGLQYIVGSEQYFYPRKRTDLLEVVRNADGSADLRVKMIVKALPANAPKEFTLDFGFIATPVKPMPEGWRAMSMSAQYNAFKGKTRGNILIYWPDEWRRITLDPDPHRSINREKVSAKVLRDRKEGRKIVPYWSRRHLPISQKNVVNPDAEGIYQDWSPDPQRSRAGRFDWMRCAATSEWSDYLLWCIDQWGKVFGPIDGAYIDEMALDPNKSARSGGGYTDYDGVRRPTYSWKADRDLYKRMHYVIAKNNGGLPAWSVAHSSATSMMEILSHYTVMLTGEHLFSGYFLDDPVLIPPKHDKMYYYSYSLPMERVRCEFYHRPWGAVITFSPCLKNQRDIMTLPIPTRDLLSRIMHADVIFWALWCNKNEIYKVEEIRRKWDIGNKAVEYIPYWENKVVTTSTPNAVISYYDKNGEKLVLVSNLARKKQQISIKLPAGVKSVVNAESGKTVPAANDMVKITLPRNDFTFLILKK